MSSSMQSGSGIQELMAAETRASQIVAEARVGESIHRLRVHGGGAVCIPTEASLC